MNICITTTAKTDAEGCAAQAPGHAVQDELTMATTAKIAKERKKPKFQVRAATVAAVRPAARVSAQVRAVPHLLPQAGARGRNSGRDQVQLVSVEFHEKHEIRT